MSSIHRAESSHRRRFRGGAVAGAVARRFRNEQSGVVLVIVAGMMVALLGMGALAIDLGSFYKAQRQAQAAADAAALAASQDLPSGTTAAQTDGTTYATTNYPGSTVAVTTPYNGSSSQVKVTVSASSPAILGSIFGVTSAKVSASAVAGTSGSTGAPSAVFAKSTNCGAKGITNNGTNVVISGGTHSNGVVWANGSNDNFGTTTYGGPSNCSLTTNGSGNTFGGGTPTVDSTNQPWPFDYSTLTFPTAPACTFTASSFSWTSSGTIPPGVYCATQNDITLGAANTTINATGCTFVAQQGKIEVDGSNLTTSGNFFANGANGVIDFNGSGVTVNGVMEATSGGINFNSGASVTGNATMVAHAFNMNSISGSIAPYPGYNNLAFYETGSQALQVGDSGYLAGGSIFAPNADIELHGTGNATGMMEGNSVTIDGSNYTLTGNGPSVGGSSGGSSLLQ